MIWLMALALAAPPVDIDLEDTAPWEGAQKALLDGPAGCWEVVGKATWDYDFGQFASSRGGAVFLGRLEDHVWSELVVKSTGEEAREGKDLPKRVYDDDQRFFPLVGRRADKEGGGSASVFTDGMDDLLGDVGLAWMSWDEGAGGAWLESRSPLENDPDAEVAIRTFFPGAGPLPTRTLVGLPERFVVGEFPQSATIRDAKLEIRGTPRGDLAFPTAEAWSARIGAFGFSFQVAQTIRYLSFERCAVEP